MNIYKGDCEVCGGWVGIQNNFGSYDTLFTRNFKILCGNCYQRIKEN